MSKRVFLAINISTKLKEKIAADFLDKLQIKGLKPVKKENLHLTMKFLGDCSEDAIEIIIHKLQALNKIKKFEIELKGIGDFEKKVIWIGVTKSNDELVKINSQINSLLSLGEEKFSSHLTLARNKFLDHDKLTDILNELNKIEFKEKIFSESLDLMESKLTPNGPKYFVLKKIEFR